MSDRPAPVLVDLAAALIEQAAWAREPAALVEAVDVAARAVTIEPHDGAARFNLALALERIGLLGQASEAWHTFMTLDSTTGWASEARARERHAARTLSASAAPPGATTADAATLAWSDAQAARAEGWDDLLGAWADGVLARRSAESPLARAESLGTRLQLRGGDASLADAVRAIAAARRHPSRLRRLARAHRAFAHGQHAFARSAFADARRAFEEARTLAGPREPLGMWAEASRAACLVQAGATGAAARASGSLLARVDTVRYPALAARARWVRGTALARTRQPEAALALFLRAAALYDRAREHENGAVMRLLAGSAEYVAGDVGSMQRSLHGALAILQAHRGSVWLHNLLYIWAQALAGDFPRAAVYVQDEGVSAAEATGSPAYLAEALLARGRLALAAGDLRYAAAVAERARALVARLPAGPEADWLRADLQLAAGATTPATVPARASTGLDSAVAFFRAFDNRVRLVRALVARAEFGFAVGRDATAESDLDEAIALVEAQHDATDSGLLRATTLEASRRLVNRLVMRRVAVGRVIDALVLIDHGRAAFARRQTKNDAPHARAADAPFAPRGEVAVEIAVIGDTVLTWTLAGRRVSLSRATVERTRLRHTVERLHSALELGGRTDDVRPALAMLYDWLLRPVEDKLGADGTPLVLIVDGEIASVPLAALYDTRRGRYLVQSHPIRFADRLSDAARSARRGPPRGALLIADPAFDRRSFADLEPLPNARVEIDSVRGSYRAVQLLVGGRAERRAVVDALGRWDVVHFAGHAVFDDSRPEYSHLVLAPSADGASARLAAADLARMDLRRLRLIVLAACRTAPGEPGRSGGLAGMSGALLRAGAGGVLGTLWRVDDASTVPLMADFHRAYGQQGDAAAALRAAQLRALRSTDPNRRSPASWAGFRYIGG